MIKILRAYAEWCGPCKLLSPIFDELKQTFPNVEFVDVDVDQDVDLVVSNSTEGIGSGTSRTAGHASESPQDDFPYGM